MAEKVQIDYEVLSRFNGSLKHIVVTLTDSDQSFRDLGDAVKYPMELSELTSKVDTLGNHWSKSRDTLKDRLLQLQARVEATGICFKDFDQEASPENRLTPGEVDKLPRA